MDDVELVKCVGCDKQIPFDDAESDWRMCEEIGAEEGYRCKPCHAVIEKEWSELASAQEAAENGSFAAMNYLRRESRRFLNDLTQR